MIADFVLHKLMGPYISEVLYGYDDERGVYELNRRRQPLSELNEDGKFVVKYSKNNEVIEGKEVERVNKFYTQNELVEIMTKNGFSNVEYRNLSSGISAIHSGWKI